MTYRVEYYLIDEDWHLISRTIYLNAAIDVAVKWYFERNNATRIVDGRNEIVFDIGHLVREGEHGDGSTTISSRINAHAERNVL